MTERAWDRLIIVSLVLFVLLSLWQAINASTNLRWAFVVIAVVSAAQLAYRVRRLRSVR
jgi:hypothetical protein